MMDDSRRAYIRSISSKASNSPVSFAYGTDVISGIATEREGEGIAGISMDRVGVEMGSSEESVRSIE